MGGLVEFSGRRGTSLSLQAPILTASGCLGDAVTVLDECLAGLGAVLTPSITLLRRRGIPPPRVVEAAAGVLYDSGLPNPGVEKTVERLLTARARAGALVVASIAAQVDDDFVTLALALETVPAVSALELNLSWPGDPRPEAGRRPEQILDLVKSLAHSTWLPLIVKLSPRADVVEAAQAAEEGGADAVCIGHGWPGSALRLDGLPRLAGRDVRLAGSAVRPLTLRLIQEVAPEIAIGVIGCGGVDSTWAAQEYLYAGARAVQVGSALYGDPTLASTIARQLAALAESAVAGTWVLDPHGGAG